MRLGERDCDGYLDHAGLAWESLRERLVATAATRLVDALSLAEEDPRREGLIEKAITGLPDELLEQALREAALTLALRDLAGD